MAEPMDVDGPRGTKRKASELVVTAPRRIQVSSINRLIVANGS